MTRSVMRWMTCGALQRNIWSTVQNHSLKDLNSLPLHFFLVHWGLLFLQASEGELEDWVKRFHDTIRYALDDMRRFAKEYMEHSAKPFFKGFELTPFALLFGTAPNLL
eukprot:441894_1